MKRTLLIVLLIGAALAAGMVVRNNRETRQTELRIAALQSVYTAIMRDDVPEPDKLTQSLRDSLTEVGFDVSTLSISETTPKAASDPVLTCSDGTRLYVVGYGGSVIAVDNETEIIEHVPAGDGVPLRGTRP